MAPLLLYSCTYSMREAHYCVSHDRLNLTNTLKHKRPIYHLPCPLILPLLYEWWLFQKNVNNPSFYIFEVVFKYLSCLQCDCRKRKCLIGFSSNKAPKFFLNLDCCCFSSQLLKFLVS